MVTHPLRLEKKKKSHMIELESCKIKTELFEKHPQMQKKKKWNVNSSSCGGVSLTGPLIRLRRDRQ